MFWFSVYEICLVLFMVVLYMYLVYIKWNLGMLLIFLEKKEKL